MSGPEFASGRGHTRLARGVTGEGRRGVVFGFGSGWSEEPVFRMQSRARVRLWRFAGKMVPTLKWRLGAAYGQCRVARELEPAGHFDGAGHRGVGSELEPPGSLVERPGDLVGVARDD